MDAPLLKSAYLEGVMSSLGSGYNQSHQCRSSSGKIERMPNPVELLFRERVGLASPDSGFSMTNSDSGWLDG